MTESMYSNDLGRTIYSRGRKEKGIVTKISSRYCASCQMTHTCYIVEWADGTKTKPCTAGVKCIGDDLEII